MTGDVGVAVVFIHAPDSVLRFTDERSAQTCLRGTAGAQAHQVTIELASGHSFSLHGRDVARARVKGIGNVLRDVLLARFQDGGTMAPLRARAAQGLEELGVDVTPLERDRYAVDRVDRGTWGRALRWLMDAATTALRVGNQ